MGVVKITPKTDDKREASLSTAKKRKDAVLPADNIFSVSNTAALDTHLALFLSKRKNVSNAEEASHKIVKLLDEAFDKAKYLVSHGYQLMNFMIIDGKPTWTISCRTYYGVDLNGNLPPLGTHAEILQALSNFINGENEHIADGGIALKDITEDEVKEALIDINAKLVDLGDSKEAILEATKEIAIERTAVDALIPLLWSDIEHKAQTLSTGARHEFGTLWGIQYKDTKGIGILNVSVEDIDTHEKLAGINLRYGSRTGKDGVRSITNLHGEAILESHNLDDAFLVASSILYDTNARPTILVAGEELTIVVKLKKKVIES